jgi:hypothetical protein
METITLLQVKQNLCRHFYLTPFDARLRNLGIMARDLNLSDAFAGGRRSNLSKFIEQLLDVLCFPNPTKNFR